MRDLPPLYLKCSPHRHSNPFNSSIHQTTSAIQSGNHVRKCKYKQIPTNSLLDPIHTTHPNPQTEYHHPEPHLRNSFRHLKNKTNLKVLPFSRPLHTPSQLYSAYKAIKLSTHTHSKMNNTFHSLIPLFPIMPPTQKSSAAQPQYNWVNKLVRGRV